MVYTATSRALAALEFFVNLEPNEARDDLLIADSKPFRYDERMFR
jgi:hypothetical protein